MSTSVPFSQICVLPAGQKSSLGTRSTALERPQVAARIMLIEVRPRSIIRFLVLEDGVHKEPQNSNDHRRLIREIERHEKRAPNGTPSPRVISSLMWEMMMALKDACIVSSCTFAMN